ncbi:MAG: hypothetical protein ACKVG7_08285 [Flavobacteriales bacterium]
MRLLIIVFIFCFELITAQEVQKNLFGFATSNTFTYCNVNDTSFVNKITDLNPKLLRFPGGAVGNFYHFGKSGYGFDFTEIDQYHDGKVPKRTRGLENSRIKKNQHQDYIDDFIQLAQETNSKAVLVANLFVDNNDILFMIEKLVTNNIEVVGVELGSELSNRNYFTKGYTIEDYIFSAKSCSKKIKDKYPNLKTAVVVAPLGKRKGHRHNIWNEKLSKLDFYDAIIIHSYAKVTKGEDKDGQMVSEEAEGKNKKEAFEIYKNRAIDYLVNQYPRQVQEYVSVFNKPIWVTEWNLQMSKTTGNTLLQSLFVANYLLELLSSPDLKNIELTTYHNLGGRDFSGSIFRNNKDKMEIQSTYFSFMMIGKIFKNDILRVEKDVEGEVFTYKCFNAKGNELFSYSIDWNLKEIICYDKSLEINGIIEEAHISSNNLFDLPDINGKFRLDSIIQIISNE